MDKARTRKTRLSFVLRDNNEIPHSHGINSVALGRSCINDQEETEAACRQVFTGGRDGKIRMFEA